MIKRLTIANYALIEHLEIVFNSGFSVITGETGAGKSIILGALSMILGQRADTKAIKNSDKKCVIEGEFDISAYALASLFEQNDWEYDATSCIIRRELLPSGKSRAFINDSPVAIAQLKELGELLIDIHSQHQNLLLGNDRYQLEVVDAMAGATEQLATYRQAYRLYKQLQSELAKRKKAAATLRDEEEYMRFQLVQFEELRLQAGEQEELELEQELLTHAEDIKSELYATTNHLDNDEAGVVSQLKAALSGLQGVAHRLPQGDELAQRLQSNYIDIKDIASEVDALQESIQVDPARLQLVQERLGAIYQLQQKYHLHTVAELLEKQQELSQRLEQIDNSDEVIELLTRKVEEQEQQTLELAAVLTQLRNAAATTFARQLVERAAPLGMPNLRFEVALTPKAHIDEMGAEVVNFLFTANKSQPLQPVAQVASGGEISRLMLCVKALIANKMALPTILFDEIDTGVSGDIADKMAGIMEQMASYMQVMSITHLPQVASKGVTHYRVYKHDVADATHTQIDCLSSEQRIEEIARMLSGSELTEAALNNARVLLAGNK